MTKQSWARRANKPVDLTGNPFFLDEKQVEWVRATLAQMSREEKIGQLFCLCSVDGTQEEAEAVFRVCKPGGMMLRPMRTEQAVQLTAALDKTKTRRVLLVGGVSANRFIRTRLAAELGRLRAATVCWPASEYSGDTAVGAAWWARNRGVVQQR